MTKQWEYVLEVFRTDLRDVERRDDVDRMLKHRGDSGMDLVSVVPQWDSLLTFWFKREVQPVDKVALRSDKVAEHDAAHDRAASTVSPDKKIIGTNPCGGIPSLSFYCDSSCPHGFLCLNETGERLIKLLPGEQLRDAYQRYLRGQDKVTLSNGVDAVVVERDAMSFAPRALKDEDREPFKFAETDHAKIDPEALRLLVIKKMHDNPHKSVAMATGLHTANGTPVSAVRIKDGQVQATVDNGASWFAIAP